MLARTYHDPTVASALPAGWHAHPQDPDGVLRWHDGAAWTSWTCPDPAKRADKPSAPSRGGSEASNGQPSATELFGPKAASGRSRTPMRSLSRLAFGDDPSHFAAQFLTILLVTVSLIAAVTLSWQTWGTQWQAKRAQAALAEEFTEDLSFTARSTTSTTQVPSPTTSPPTTAFGSDFSPSAPLAQIKIPAISLDHVVVKGTDVPDLKKGPGWMVGTAGLGHPGNAVISGHRTTYGGVFRHLDKLKTGDRIIISVPGQPEVVYEVRANFVVSPSDVWVTNSTPGARLTLTTCTPVGSDRQRLVIQAELVSGAHASKALPASSWSQSRP